MNRRLRRVATLLAIAATVTLAVSERVEAHATIVATTPMQGDVLADPPTEIVLTFSEPVDTVPDSIRLVAADGRRIEVGRPERSDGGQRITSPLGAVSSGGYVVAWQVVSGDSHPIRGAFTFSVGEAANPDLDDAIVSDVFDTSADQPAATGRAVGRTLSYGGIGVATGGLLVLARCAPSMLTTRRAGLVLWAAVAVGAVGTVILLGAQARTLTGDAVATDSWRAVVGTRSGRWWAIRLLAVTLLATLVRLRRLALRPPAYAVLVAATIALWTVVTAGGHAVTGRAPVVGFVATVAHLGAMSVWLGGLVVLFAAVERTGWWSTAARFSPYAMGAVVVLAVSGTVNAVRQGAFGVDVTESSYGRWLVVKLVVVVVVVAVASGSRRLTRHVKALRTDPVAVPVPAGTLSAAEVRIAGGDVERSLRRRVVLEAAGLGLVMVATAGLVDSAPPAVDAAGPATATVTVDDVTMQLVVDPNVTGGTTMHATLTSPDPAWARPDEVTVEATLASEGIGPLAFATVSAGPQHVIAADANFPLPGDWTVAVTARYGDFDQLVFTAPINIR